MKKRTLSLMVLAAMMLASASWVGCTQKDYGSDIEGLQKQITDNKTAIDALKTAMGKGTMITKVEKTENGYKLTLSDNTVLTLQNGTNGANGADAPAPQLRVNAAKNWEVSTDGGNTWSEVKDASGNSIADAKTFVQNYVQIDANGYLVIGDKITSFAYDVTIPQVTILPDRLIALITVPNANGGFDTARVPMEGYFDQWSVTGVQSVASKTTLAITQVTLQADANIDGVDYPSGTTVYTSTGMPVVLNPSMIDATAIPFTMVASLENGEAYELPLQLKATAGTDQKISTITKAAASTAVWTINLASASGYGLKGAASNVALCATNQNGTQTLSDYVFAITESAGSSAATTTSVVDAEGFQGADAVVAPATNIAASTLYTTDPDDASKVAIFREDGSLVTGQAGKYEHYTGAYHVVLLPSPAARDLAPTPDPVAPVEIGLTYECLGLDGAAASPVALKAKFIQDSPIARQYVVADAFVPSGNDAAKVLDITKEELLTALFGDNTITKAEFVAKGINFKIKPDTKAAERNVTVEYYMDNNKVAAPATTAAFNKVKITAPQAAFFAREYIPVADRYSFACTFQLGGNTPPTYTLDFDVVFGLDGTSPVLSSAWTGTAPQIANSATEIQINLTDVTLYNDAESSNAITTTGAVLEFSGIEANDKVSLSFDPDTDKYTLVRTAAEAPDVDETVSITFLGTDAWGKEFSVTQDVTIKGA